MSDRPQLSLGKPPETLQKKLSTVPRAWLLLIVLLNLAALGCLVRLVRHEFVRRVFQEFAGRRLGRGVEGCGHGPGGQES